MTSLEKIISVVDSEFAECRNIYDEALSYENAVLEDMLSYIGSHQGKMMRPLLVLLVAKMHKESQPATCTLLPATLPSLAAAYEFFHTASLVHDDVVDDSDERRGQASVNYRFTNKRAVLAGDYLLSLALYNISIQGNPKLVEIMSEAAANLSIGELIQLNYETVKTDETDKSDSLQKDAKGTTTYLKIIENKTAALFRACAQSGAISANASEEEVEQMREFGEAVGMMFQIKDDVLDGEIENEFAASLIENYQKTANSILDRYPDSPIRQALFDYVDYVISREY